MASHVPHEKNKRDARRTRHSFLSIYVSSPFPSSCPSQAKKDSNCLPLRVYPDVLRSRLAGAKSGSLHFPVRETNRCRFGARCGGYPLWVVLDNQHPWNGGI
ncbi:hypothetical protein [Aneurinibacillus migulanus]|uniref:hypothetical protein n=1 Tax=Aneurinibacillus migulanus TaxID=47500 RepID=UPI00126A74E0|nr:hypothetical protein [Aneurinibacillus migulanus]MCP1357895.1 hypothetical protein [Aneurinibacillus migulanus]